MKMAPIQIMNCSIAEMAMFNSPKMTYMQSCSAWGPFLGSALMQNVLEPFLNTYWGGL